MIHSQPVFKQYLVATINSNVSKQSKLLIKQLTKQQESFLTRIKIMFFRTKLPTIHNMNKTIAQKKCLAEFFLKVN